MSFSVEEKVLSLKSREGEEFSVKESVADQSVKIKKMMEHGCTEGAIRLSIVKSNTLAMVLEYLNKHADSGVSGEDKKDFDSEFVKKELDVLFDLMWVASYMEINELFNLLYQTIANLVKNRAVKKVSNIFGIENNFTPEEEEAVRNENAGMGRYPENDFTPGWGVTQRMTLRQRKKKPMPGRSSEMIF